MTWKIKGKSRRPEEILSAIDMVVDILEKQTDWMESSRLVREILKKRDVTERQAYRYLEKTLDAQKIRKIKLGGDVVYGLSDWAFPETSKKQDNLTFQDAFYYRRFKNLEQISNENIEGNHERAYSALLHMKAMLPQHLKEKVNPYFEQAEKELERYQGIDYLARVETHYAMYDIVRYLVDKVSTILHETLER